jgi:hypothetical protein
MRPIDGMAYARARAAREVNAPEWWIGAGAIRTAVWDRLHGYAQPTPLADLDLIYFDLTISPRSAIVGSKRP